MSECRIVVPLVPPNPSGKCKCGCGRDAPIAKVTNRRQGCVKGFPQQYVMGHQTRLRQPYTVKDKTGCWEWMGYVDACGYGRTSTGTRSRSKQAHIVYWEKHRGPVPAGLQLDHLCKNKRCVNPDHLEAVTHAENVRRQDQVKLSPEIAEQIRRAFVPSPFGGRRGGNISELCARFTVGRSQIYRIVKRESWKTK